VRYEVTVEWREADENPLPDYPREPLCGPETAGFSSGENN